MKHKRYDFCGWATKNNLKCSDGLIIRKDAFKCNDGQVVPLVWNHQHGEVYNVLGHAQLFNKDEGIYAYGYLNDSDEGQAARYRLENGDITAMSIYANQLQKNGSNVVHGNIREVSLVIAPANPGAFIDSVTLAHGDDPESENEGIVYTGEPIEIFHADEEAGEDPDDSKEEKPKGDEDNEDDGDDKDDEDEGSGKTVGDILDTMTEEQQDLFYNFIGQKLDKENEDMKHNVFENDNRTSVLQHSDQEAIINLAKSSQVGSFQTALLIFAEDNDLTLQHDGTSEVATAGGFYQTGDGNVTTLFPEYKDLKPGAPELITNDQGWIGVVMAKVHKSPISRIRTGQVDIRNIESLRAKGYEKGKKKTLAGNFRLVRRTTDPQTVYVKNALHRDDIIDITDFDYVQYLYNIDRMMLNEELATAIMLGDGRDDGEEGKISADHIRPIWTDDELYTLHYDLNIAAARAELQGTETGNHFGDNYVTAEAMITAVLYAREKFKGTGTPDMFITPHMLNVMLLAKDFNGRRIYSSVNELASALNVGHIYTAEQFAGKTRTVEVDNVTKTKKLVAIICNLNDYHLGATKGGEVTHFTQFDIDFNQEKSLLETRVSGALTKVYSAIVIEEDVTSGTSSDDDGDDGQG